MRRLCCPSPWLLAVLFLLGLARPALAEVFCVTTAVDLHNALTNVAANGQDDEIRIVQGTYVGNFVYASTQANKLSVLGGYTAGCASRVLDPANTILDGNQANNVLVLSAPDVAPEFLLEGLTLRNGVKHESGFGGGLYAVVGNLGAMTVNLSHIENNSHCGANIFATTATLNNNNISGNVACGAFIDATTAILTNNNITGNMSSSGAEIGATTAILINNNITDNNAKWNDGGGVRIGATTAILTNNNITGNRTWVHGTIGYDGYGGGALIDATTAILTNNNITGNTARTGGGGLSLRLGGNETHDSARLYNNLFWDNVADGNQGADLLISNDDDGDYLPTPVTLLANNFDQSAVGFKITLPITIDPSNLNKVDPLFVDASTGDFHLQPGSPMIDAGYPGTPDLPEFDIAGTPRVLGDSVDIGAYEYDDGSDPKAILTLTLAGDGSGTVTSSPTGIDCGTDCFQPYDLDTPVTLTATPADTNSVLEGWSGDADCADGQVTMTTHLSCTATFSAVRQLTVTRAGGGDGLVTSAPSGISCGAACTAYFYQGEAVTLTATPDASSTFASWSGDATCPHPVLTVDRACTANFAPLLYRLYLFVYGSGGGTVTSAPAGINCGADCEQDYRAGTVVTLTAAANANSTFWGWSGPCTGPEPTCEVTLTAVSGLAAIFNLKTYIVTATAGTGGTISPASQNVAHGDATSFTVTPNDGYSANVTGCGGSLSGTTYTTGPITAACAVSASFSLKTYTVTASAGTGGAISPASRSVAHGATTSFTVTPNTGYSIGTVSGCGGSLSGNTYSTGATTAACTVSASFSLKTYTVTASAGLHGTISPASRSVAYGATTSFTVTPNAGYSANVTGCGGSLSGTTYTTGAIAAACAVSASFVPQVTVVASDNVATEKGLTTGTFTFSRGGATTSALTLSYQVTGTAAAGQDYRALGTSVTFPAGKRQVTKVLVPFQDRLVEPDETIILTLLPRAAYALGNPVSARITLRSDD